MDDKESREPLINPYVIPAWYVHAVFSSKPVLYTVSRAIMCSKPRPSNRRATNQLKNSQKVAQRHRTVQKCSYSTHVYIYNIYIYAKFMTNFPAGAFDEYEQRSKYIENMMV